MHCGLFSSIPDLYLLDASNTPLDVTTQNASRHCPRRQNHPWLRTTALNQINHLKQLTCSYVASLCGWPAFTTVDPCLCVCCFCVEQGELIVALRSNLAAAYSVKKFEVYHLHIICGWFSAPKAEMSNSYRDVWAISLKCVLSGL